MKTLDEMSLTERVKLYADGDPEHGLPAHGFDFSHEDAEAIMSALEAADKRIAELEAQLPKRGKWITHPEVKNIYGGVYIECPFCGEKYVVQNVSDEKFCRNCGADMRAKMEVQDG